MPSNTVQRGEPQNPLGITKRTKNGGWDPCVTRSSDRDKAISVKTFYLIGASRQPAFTIWTFLDILHAPFGEPVLGRVVGPGVPVISRYSFDRAHPESVRQRGTMRFVASRSSGVRFGDE